MQTRLRLSLLTSFALLALSCGCASRRVDVHETGEAVFSVRPRKRTGDPVARARAAIQKAEDPAQFLDERVRSGFATSLAGALQVDPAGVLVGQDPVAFPLPMPDGVQVALGYRFAPASVRQEHAWIRVRCPMTVTLALLEVPDPRSGSYDRLAVWCALGYLARSLQDAGFELSEDTEAQLAAPPFVPGDAEE
ncbi:MAG: hypothetical protein KDD82_14330 [Planctomycetes bacterium]|nr:hypothetical protein [Planctomycetota bacterium]